MSIECSPKLRLAGWVRRTSALGPGARAAIWVQGCPFRCPGCISPHTHAFEGGSVVSVADLADRLTAVPDVEGLTISGGEPFSQAGALALLVEELRRRTTWSFMCYTGHRLADLQRRAQSDEVLLRFLRSLDVLVDGLYVEELHTARRWRGSSNQEVHLLTPRYRDLQQSLDDDVVSVEAHVDEEGVAQFIGIPPRGFVRDVLRAFERRGVPLKELC